jgi:hypothetical protein
MSEILVPLLLFALVLIRPLMQLFVLAITIIWVGAELVIYSVRLAGKVSNIPPGPDGFFHRFNSERGQR